MPSGSQQSDAAGNLDLALRQAQHDMSYSTAPISEWGLNSATRDYYRQMLDTFTSDRARAMGGASSLAAGRGYSQGLTNPFAASQRAEQSVYGQYAGGLGNLLTGQAQSLLQNKSTAFNSQLAANQSQRQFLLSLLQQRARNMENMNTSSPLGSILGGVGMIAGTAIGGPMGGMAGGYLGSQFGGQQKPNQGTPSQSGTGGFYPLTDPATGQIIGYI